MARNVSLGSGNATLSKGSSTLSEEVNLNTGILLLVVLVGFMVGAVIPLPRKV